MIRRIKKILCICIAICIFTNNFLFAAPTDSANFENDNGGIKSIGYLDAADALKEEPGNVVGDLLVTGDSYGGYFVSFLKAFFGYNIEKNKYCRPQKTVIENYPIYELAFITQYDYVVLSIGFNDYIKQTNINDFYHYIYLLVKLAMLYDKTLILHSYLSVPFRHENELYKFEDYDLELRKLATEYDNVEYIDLTDLQDKPEFLNADLIHYNEKMYLELYSRINEMMIRKKKESKIIMPQ